MRIPCCLLLVLFLLGPGCAGAGGEGAARPRPTAAGAGLRVTVLQTSDLHGHARGAGHVGAGPSARGGYARIAAYVEAVRAAAGHPVLLVDSGDWGMGTLYDLTLGRRPLPLWFAEALRYDCITLGNHEFDHASAGLAGILAAARREFAFRTPIVASNLELRGDPHLGPLTGPGRPIQATRVQTLVSGVRVGYLGLMGREAALDAASDPVRFTGYGRDYARIQRLVDDLRGPRGCALVIALDHAGARDGGAAGEDVELARHVAGIDVIASGHAHEPLDAARAVADGPWTTLVCGAGAFGTHVSRLDLALRPGGGVDLEGSENVPMTDAALAGRGVPVPADPAFGRVVETADRVLNRALGGILAQLPGFGADPGGDPARGIYHPVASCPRDLRSNGRAAFPAPNGLGDLCADALRAVSNGLLAAGAGAAGADPTPFTAAVLATGELRGGLEAGAPVTFADVFGLLPLGLSPDPDQRDVTGAPLVSAYLDPDGCRMLRALQLLVQAGLADGDLYLNLSGLRYQLDPRGAGAFFAAASAAAALDLTKRRAGEGSAKAARALEAVAALAGDRGAALEALLAAGNPYAGALVRLADRDPDPARVAANREVLGQVAAATVREAGSPDPGRPVAGIPAGAPRLTALLMAKAMEAIGPVSAFAPDDPACTGPATPLGPGRVRVVLDSYLVLMADRVQARLGTRAVLYQEAQGQARLSAASPEGLGALLAHRVRLAPGEAGRELKAWMAALLYLATPPDRGGHFRDGRITGEYDSDPDFRRFAEAGAAVRVRNAAYPLEAIGHLAALAASLRRAP
jgi:hypothetical protein